jgi:serine/threonine-protein kinase
VLGNQICRLLRSSPGHRHIPIIHCSTIPDEMRHELDMLDIGANAYIAKPIDMELLGSTIQQLLPSVTAPRPTPVECPPQEFAGFRLESVLGSGGIGTTYKATQLVLNRSVVLKVLLRTSAEEEPEITRFFSEAQVIAKLNHRNIVKVFDVGKTKAVYYIAREFIEGVPLTTLYGRDSKEPAWVDTLAIIRQMIDALAYLHDMNIVHRDVRPGNFLMADIGVLKLTDFGISRASGLHDVGYTPRGLSLNTPIFTAPEQLEGERPTGRSDQYSLARTILHLFERGATVTPVRNLWQFRPDLPADLSAALERCMQSDPDQRYATMREAGKAILSACALHNPEPLMPSAH